MLLTQNNPSLLQDVLNRRLLFKTSYRKSKETITHHLLNWAERKLSMQPKFVAAQKMLLKTETAKHS